MIDKIVAGAILFMLTIGAAIMITDDKPSTVSKKRQMEIGHYSKVCYDNVVYVTGMKRLAVYINPISLKPMNCKGK